MVTVDQDNLSPEAGESFSAALIDLLDFQAALNERSNKSEAAIASFQQKELNE